MKSPHVLLRSVLAVVLLCGMLAPAGLRAGVTELRPAGESDNGGNSSGPRDLSGITDDPDPFGIRYGIFPRPPSYVVWGSAEATVGSGRPEARVPRPGVNLVVDPRSGRVIGFETVGLDESTARSGGAFFGADGYVRIAVPAPRLRRR